MRKQERNKPEYREEGFHKLRIDGDTILLDGFEVLGVAAYALSYEARGIPKLVLEILLDPDMHVSPAEPAGNDARRCGGQDA